MGTRVPPEPSEPFSGEARRTVLIVENDAFLRSMYGYLLEQDGFFVLAAPDVVTALFIADTHWGAISLVVCDTLLPGLGKLEAWRSAQKNGSNPRVLLLSNDPNHASFDLPVLAKPFHPDSFLRLVRELTGPRRTPSSRM